MAIIAIVNIISHIFDLLENTRITFEEALQLLTALSKYIPPQSAENDQCRIEIKFIFKRWKDV
jgi:hypothetical protein